MRGLFQELALGLLVLWAVMPPLGCGRRQTCRRLAERNRECSETFEQVVASGLQDGKTSRLGGKARRDLAQRIGQQVRRAYTSRAFLDACQKAWQGREAGDTKMQRAARSCLAKASCEDYVRCMLSLHRDETP